MRLRRVLQRFIDVKYGGRRSIWDQISAYQRMRVKEPTAFNTLYSALSSFKITHGLIRVPFSSSLVHSFLIIDYPHIIEVGAILLHESLMNRIRGDIEVPILLGRKFDHEAMGKASLSRLNIQFAYEGGSQYEPGPPLDCCLRLQMKKRYMVDSKRDADMCLSARACHRRTLFVSVGPHSEELPALHEYYVHLHLFSQLRPARTSA